MRSPSFDAGGFRWHNYPPHCSGKLSHLLNALALTLSPGHGSLRAPPATMSPPPAEEMSMTKAELVDHVAATVQLSKAQTDAVLTQCLQAIIEALQAGESVELRGFGRFHLRHRQPRTGRNPRTRESVQIPAKAVPTFAAGKAFQEQVQPRAAAGGTA